MPFSKARALSPVLCTSITVVNDQRMRDRRNIMLREPLPADLESLLKDTPPPP
jgi:hypothetical protein